jgi:hypothetical protein
MLSNATLLCRYDTGTCECKTGFGDVGCDKTLTPLINGGAVHVE